MNNERNQYLLNQNIAALQDMLDNGISPQGNALTPKRRREMIKTLAKLKRQASGGSKPVRTALLVAFILAAAALPARAYTMLNYTIDAHWTPGNVPFYIDLGQYDGAAKTALADWSQYTGATHLSGIDVTSGSAWGNGRNDIAWSTNEPLNYVWSSNTLAICLPNFSWETGAFIETDLVFNAAFSWGSFDAPSGYGGYDIGRVLLHEIGHGIGLGHSQDGSVMNPYYQSNVWTLSADDIAGAQHLYGTSSVPESGATLGLLTLALVALVWAGRKV